MLSSGGDLAAWLHDILRRPPPLESSQTRDGDYLSTQSLQHGFFSIDLFLLGQSFGLSLARSLASRLSLSGFEVRGIVALDCRCVERTALSDVYVVPRSLRQGLTSPRFRCTAAEIHFVTPCVPRMTLSARDFCSCAVICPEASLASTSANLCHVRDGDHWDVPVSHAWDIVRSLS